MDYKITGYEPAQLFHFFEEVSAIPRGSGNEKGISDFLVAFAKERGLDVYQDEVYNVIIRKPASAGAENAPTVMLQGHIDMVCDKLGSVEHDFTTDGIDLVVKDGVLTANGTTLGADNGIAVALMLTVLNDDSIAHPALECVFTTDEETGLVGAETLDKSQISARTMINLDSEEEGVATVSCAGGVVVTYTCPIAREHKTGSTLTLDISGLLGGHSGSDIHLERGNGNLIMARIIDRLMVAGEPAIVSFNGGTKDNAINRECKAVLVYADHAAAEAAAQVARGIIADVTASNERISASTGHNVDTLARRLRALLLDDGSHTPPSDGLAPNARQSLALERALHELEALLADIAAGSPYDCCSVRLDAAAALLGEVTGLDSPEEVLNRVFSSFCIGK